MRYDPELQVVDVVLNDLTCWICGKEFNKEIKKKSMTRYHGLPKFLNPKKNVLIPIHHGCHDKLNSNDTPTLISFSHSIIRDFQTLSNKVDALKNSMWKKLDMSTKEGILTQNREKAN